MEIQPVCQKVKCTKLIEATEFFSQIIHVDQLSIYGHQFLSDLFKMRSSAVYALDSKKDRYYLNNYLGQPPPIKSFPVNLAFEEIATKIGRVMVRDFQRYFPENFLTAYPITLLIPIITKDSLFGFILADCNLAEEGFDLPFAEAIKNLLCNAYFVSKERAEGQLQQQAMNRRLYDFLLLQHSSRLLMAELDLDVLCQMCVDAVRELTASSATGFALYDPRLDKIVVKGFTDIINFKKIYAEVSWIGPDRPGQLIYNTNKDAHLLQEHFDCPDIFAKMQATHVILLTKGKVEGFLTIAEPVSQMPHTEETLELATNIASALIVAIENARHVREIKQQHQLLQDSYNAIKTMRSIIRTITSSESLLELSEIIMQTLAINCHITRGCLVVWDAEQQKYRSHSTLGLDDQEISVKLTETGYSHARRGIINDTRPKSVPIYLTSDSPLPFTGSTLVAPASIDMLDDQHRGIVGLIICDGASVTLTNQEYTFIETASSCIAPFIMHMIALQKLQRDSKLDPYAKFLKQLDSFAQDRQNYFMDFCVYYKADFASPFAERDMTAYDGLRWHRLGKTLVVIAYTEEDVDKSKFDGILEGFPAEIIEALEKIL